MAFVYLQQNNHHVDNISAKMSALRGKVSELERAAAQRKAKLDENSAFLQFNWKADVVESWIGTITVCSVSSIKVYREYVAKYYIDASIVLLLVYTFHKCLIRDDSHCTQFISVNPD